MKKLLVTGGTGSFGNSLVERELHQDWDEIRIFSRDEKKQSEARKKFGNGNVSFYIGDVRDSASTDNAMQGITHIFHAAALKQVPSCEFFPDQAIKTNILGTQNIIASAKKFGVKRFVLLSTDKAAYPINAMGVSKAMAEKIALAEAFNSPENELVINITRYGNVMGSRGSVIPLFYEQLKAGQELTITNPNMTRFMMSLSESVDLVQYAMINGKPGELFINKAPSATVQAVAEAMAEMLNIGLRAKTIGVRGGEKLYETLVTQEEMARAKDEGQYFRVSPDPNYLGYSTFFEVGTSFSRQTQEFNSDNATTISKEALVSWFNKLGFAEGKFHE
jgi:UDP-N-acetylglucosamine 4,6-dehydratase